MIARLVCDENEYLYGSLYVYVSILCIFFNRVEVWMYDVGMRGLVSPQLYEETKVVMIVFGVQNRTNIVSVTACSLFFVNSFIFRVSWTLRYKILFMIWILTS